MGIKLRSAAWVMAGVLPVAAGLVASAFVPAHAAVTCPGRVASDFNGDLIADLLVGDPLAGPAFNDVQTGSVTVFYGSDVAGIPEGTNSLITPGMAGMPVNLSGGDFGRAVTPGYFNDDCFADAVISAPRSNAVVVLYGSNSGLTTQGSATFNADAFVEEPGADDFGSALTAGDFNGDGWDDLAVGAWRGDQFHDAVLRGGAVGIFPGSATGLTMTGSQWITQQTAGVPGANEYWDGFGTSVAAGDLTGDGRAELVVGVPGEDIGSTADAGSIVVLRGSTSGLTTSGSQAWSQSTSGVPGASERNDRFGAAVAVGDINNDGRADVAVGAPGEAVGTRSGAGAVTVFRGVAAGLTASGSQNWNQDTPAVPGAAESGDGFGTSVALGDFTLDGRADLVAGAPGEDVGTAANAGFANLLRGGSSLLITANAAGFSQSNVGQPIQAGANFGAAVVAKKGPLVTNGALIVGVPGQRGPSASDATGAIVSIGGGSDALNFGDVSYLHAYFFVVSGGADRRIGAILG